MNKTKSHKLLETVLKDYMKSREIIQVLIDDKEEKKPELTIKNVLRDKRDRIKCTYNIDSRIVDLLDQHCKENLINQSDVVNIALLEYLKN